MEVDFCSSALAVRRSALVVARYPYLLYSLSFLCFLLLLSRFFSLFLPVRAPALSLFLSPRAPPVYDCPVYGTGHSVDLCLYTIVKPPEHVAHTPLSANPSHHRRPSSEHPRRFIIYLVSRLLFFLLLHTVIAATVTSFVHRLFPPPDPPTRLLLPTAGVSGGSRLHSFITPRF